MAIDPGLSDHQKKSVTQVVSVKFPTRVDRAGWFGTGFVGTSSLKLVFDPGKAKFDSAAYVTTVMEPHLVPLWHRCCEGYR